MPLKIKLIKCYYYYYPCDVHYSVSIDYLPTVDLVDQLVLIAHY